MRFHRISPVADWTQNRSFMALADLAAQLDIAPPDNIHAFAAMVAPLCGDSALVVDIIAAATVQLTQTPLRELTVRGFVAGPMWGIAVAEWPRAGVTVALIDSLFDASDFQPHMVFDDSFSLIRLLAGGPVTLERVDCAAPGGPVVQRRTMVLNPDDQLLLHHATSQIRLVGLTRDAVLLRVGCSRAGAAPLALRYDLARGRPVQQLCADIAASRMMALIDVAADSQRPDRGTVLAQLTTHRLAALRWQAARHWLVVDSDAALPAIAAMAENDGDAGVRDAARATVAMVTAMLAKADAA